MNYIVIDLEFNQFFDFTNEETKNTVEDCPFEIIQIGMVKLNSNLKIISHKNLYIKSIIYQKIHPHVERITGITETFLKDKPEFTKIYPEFIKFVQPKDNILCVWGSTDIITLFRNINYYNLDTCSLPNNYIDVQNLANLYLKHPSGMSIGLKDAVERLNISMDKPFHNALHDAIYTCEILKVVKNKPLKINSINKHHKEQKLEVNVISLYKFVEKEFGRKLTRKEKSIIKKVYILGRKDTFKNK